VDYAIGWLTTDDGIDPLELARAAEHHGFESLFVPDHTHVPASRETPFPHPPYGELPREYYRIRDPFITLASIASVTTTLKLGTSVCLVPERDPIVLAKQVATLDLVSGGRVLLGVGAGWNREEMRNHGTDPRTRMAVLRERCEAMKAIWTNERAAYHGKFVHFDEIFSWPKPIQQPHPPVIVGGNGPSVLDRVLAFGDGWIPGHQKDLDGLAARIAELRERGAASGRGPLPVTLIFARLDCLERYAEMGVDRCLFMLPSAPDEARSKLEDLAQALGLS
jgi:probable F420-dependent oxidoreductase